MSVVFTRRRVVTLLLGLAAVVVAVRVEAQFRQRGFSNARIATSADVDGGFQFCRIAFPDDFRGGRNSGSWSVDWPRADINLSIRLSELTKADVNLNAAGDPNHLLMRLSDDVLFQCPFVMMTEVGSAGLSNQDVERLRLYLLKGGFLWADDFWGTEEWEWWAAQMNRILPFDEYPIVDLPPTHPLFSTQFQIKETPQIAAINHWANTGGGTSERYQDSEVVHTRAVLSEDGHIMVLMTHNTDLGDSFEREADDPQYFYTMSVPGYAFGVNTLLYALTH